MTVRIEVEVLAEGESQQALATTLGAGGLFVQTEEPLEIGTPLLTRFRLPGQETLHEIAGRVVWTQRKEDLPARTPGMGISFADPAAGAVLATDLEAFETGRVLSE